MRLADQPVVFRPLMLSTWSPGLKKSPPLRSKPDSVGPLLRSKSTSVPGHLSPIFAVILFDQQLGVGVLERADQGGRGALIEVTFTQRVDVVAVDGRDDVLEEPRLLVDPTIGRRGGPEQPSAADERNRHDGGERDPTRTG